MIETVFAVLTVLSVFFLFKHSRKAGFRRWLVCGGMVLIAIPGVITIVDSLLPGEDSFHREGDAVYVPAGDPVAFEEAEDFLLRGIVVITGLEEYPVDRVQAVLSMNEKKQFTLKDGKELGLRLGLDSPLARGRRLDLDHKLRHWGSSSGGQSSLNILNTLEIEEGYPAGHVSLPLGNMDLSPFGSLLMDRHTPGWIHLFFTPLRDKQSIEQRPIRAWWDDHASTLLSAVQQPAGKGIRERVFIGGWITASGFLFLLAGTICLLCATFHKARILCFIVLYLLVYISAMDMLVLRIQSAGLLDEAPEAAARAAKEVAGSRLHPLSALNNLLEAAASEGSPKARLYAIRCLDRKPLAEALRKEEEVRERLNALTRDPDEDVAQAAKRIVRWIEAGG